MIHTDLIVRPRQSTLIGLSAAGAFIVGLIVAGAFRTGQPIVAWIGVAAALLFLPAVDWYRQTLVVGDDGLVRKSFRRTTRLLFSEIESYGFWKQWVYKSGTWLWLTVAGRDGTRIDVPAGVCSREDIALLVGRDRRTRANGCSVRRRDRVDAIRARGGVCVQPQAHRGTDQKRRRHRALEPSVHRS